MSHLIAAVLLVAAVHARGANPVCRFAEPPKIVVNDGKGLLQSWEVDVSTVWRSGLMPDSTSYQSFVSNVRALLKVSEMPRDPRAQPGPDGLNARLMHAGGTGKVGPINCLEALLFSKQAERRPMETEPTEFLAFILRRGDRLKIWYYTVDEPGIGRLGPLTGAVGADVAAGWRPYLNLHNHNFFLDKKPIVHGLSWPSAIDIQLMKNLSFGGRAFETTAVTNGFSTTRLTQRELKRFKGAGEP